MRPKAKGLYTLYNIPESSYFHGYTDQRGDLCRNPICKNARQFNGGRKLIGYCSKECWHKHLEDTRASAKERVAAYLAKNAKSAIDL